MSHDHHTIICENCGTRIGGCRCMEGGGNIRREGYCSKCQKLGPLGKAAVAVLTPARPDTLVAFCDRNKGKVLDFTAPPDPSPEHVKLIQDFGAAVMAQTMASARSASDLYNAPYAEATKAHMAAPLAEFTRLQALVEEWKLLWGPIMEFGQRNSQALGIKLGSSISDWVLETMKERAALRSAPSPQGLESDRVVQCLRAQSYEHCADKKDRHTHDYQIEHQAVIHFLASQAPTPSETLTAKPIPDCNCKRAEGEPHDKGCALRIALGGWDYHDDEKPETLTAPARPDIEINLPDGKVKVYGFAGQTKDAPDFFDRLAITVRTMVENDMIRFSAIPASPSLPDTLEGK